MKVQMKQWWSCCDQSPSGILLVVEPDLPDSEMLMLNHVCTPVLLYTRLNWGVQGDIFPLLGRVYSKTGVQTWLKKNIPEYGRSSSTTNNIPLGD